MPALFIRAVSNVLLSLVPVYCKERSEKGIGFVLTMTALIILTLDVFSMRSLVLSVVNAGHK